MVMLMYYVGCAFSQSVDGMDTLRIDSTQLQLFSSRRHNDVQAPASYSASSNTRAFCSCFSSSLFPCAIDVSTRGE